MLWMVLCFMIGPWVIFVFLQLNGVEVDYAFALLLSMTYFIALYSEAYEGVTRGIYRLSNKRTIKAPSPLFVFGKMMQTVVPGQSKLVFSWDSYFELDYCAYDREKKVIAYSEDFHGEEQSFGDEVDITTIPPQERNYPLVQYSLIARQIGHALQLEHPGALLKCQWKLGGWADFAGFLFAYPLVLGTVLWTDTPTTAQILVAVGVSLLAIVMLYVSLSVPVEVRARRIGLDLLRRLDYFDEGAYRRMRFFLTLYTIVVICLIFLLVVAIFTPMSKCASGGGKG